MSNLTKKDLHAAQFRAWIFQIFGFNFETMNSMGWTLAMGPSLEKLYTDNPELVAEKLNKHMQFYNTHPYMHNIIFGAALALEETKEEGCTDAAIALRTGLMGPFAGLGDSLFFVTLKVILGSIAAYMALEGSAIGVAIAFCGMLPVLFLRYRFFWIGYNQGTKFITNNKDKLQLLTESAVILGLMVIGAMIVSSVKITIPFVYTNGDVSLVAQDILDSILVSLLPVLVTTGIYKALNIKGMTTIRLVWIIIILSIILHFFGILA